MRKNVLKKILAGMMALSVMAGTGMTVSAVETEYGGLSAAISYEQRLQIFQKSQEYGDGGEITELLESDEYYYTITEDGNVALLFYKGQDTNVIVPSEIGRKTVTEIRWSVFSNYAELESVVLPDTLEKINGGFEGCDNLKELNIPKNVSFIGTSWSYHYGNGLCAINVAPENMTYSSEDGVLFNKDKTQLLLFPKNKTGRYVIPDSVVQIQPHTFYGCKGLTEIIIPNSVSVIGSDAFCDCTGLTEMVIPDSVYMIGTDVFCGCTNLKSVVFSKNIQTLRGRMFYWCDSLEEVVIPDGVTAMQFGMFSHCPSLKSIHLPKSMKNIIVDDGMIFSVCDGLESITVDEDNPYLECEDGVLFTREVTTAVGGKSKTLVRYPSAKSDAYRVPDGVTGICSYAFRDAKGLSTVTLPASLSAIGDYAFSGDEKLESIHIPNGVSHIGAGAFMGCSNLKEIQLPHSLTLCETSAFYDCDSLTSITIPSSVQSVWGYMFENCDNLSKVTLEDGVKYINAYAFSQCPALKDVYIPSTVQDINRNAFSKSPNVTIHGRKGSYAETFANTMNIPFIDNLGNTSEISADTIMLGQTVAVRAKSSQTGCTYAVLYKKSYDKKWTVRQNYSTNDTITVKPAKAADYQICVKVRDSNGNISKKFFDVSVKDKLVNTSDISATTVKQGGTLTVNGSAVGGIGDYTYAVYYKPKNTWQWTTKQSYRKNAVTAIKFSEFSDYDVCIKVKDEKGNIAKKYFTVSVYQVPSVTVAVSPETAVFGEPVTISCSSDEPDCRYAVYEMGQNGGWSILQNYSTNTKITFVPYRTGTITLCVKVKNANGDISKKYFPVEVISHIS